MSRTPCPFKIADVKRALRIAKDMGLEVTGYTIEPDGTIQVATGKPDEAAIANPLIQRLRVVKP